MDDYSPGTRRLLFHVGLDWPPMPGITAESDQDAVDAALSEFDRQMCGALSADAYEHGAWPAPDAFRDALRLALDEQRDARISERIAYTLVRCECREPSTISALNMWDSQLFRWQEAQLTARDLLAKCQAAGVAGNPSDEYLQRLDRWIQDPPAALGQVGRGGILIPALFNGRVAYGFLHNDGDGPKYAKLVMDLARIAMPPLAVSEVTQTEEAFPEQADLARLEKEIGGMIPAELRGTPVVIQPDVVWRLDVSLDDSNATLRVKGNTAWMNDMGLAGEMNALLARLGRRDRVLRFGDARGHGGFSAKYIVADPRVFIPLCRELGIPLLKSPQWIQYQA